MSKRGRPTAYKPAFCKKASELCARGATDPDVAKALGVHLVTLYRWQAKYPEFRNALKLGKAPADDRVMRSLYHRAIGYTYEAEEVKILADGTVVRQTVVKHVPPDTTAMIFWLKNRRPQEWREQTDLRHRFDLSELPDERLERLAELRRLVAAPGGDRDGDQAPEGAEGPPDRGTRH